MSFFKQKKKNGKHGYSSPDFFNKQPKISFNHLEDTITLSYEESTESSSDNKAFTKEPVIQRDSISNKASTLAQNIESSSYAKVNKTVSTDEVANNNLANYEEENFSDFDANDTLLISEREKKVLLPYSKKDIDSYLYAFSDKYSNAQDVIDNEFTYSLKYFSNFSKAARFREAFALYKDREGRTTFESISFAFKTMKISNLQPAIIAACRSERVFKDYLSCLENNELDNFKHFKIEYKLSPSIR